MLFLRPFLGDADTSGSEPHFENHWLREWALYKCTCVQVYHLSAIYFQTNYKMPAEKSTDNLIEETLYVISYFSLVAFKIICLGSFLVAQLFKDLASLLWLGSWLRHRFDPWPRNFCMLWTWPKNIT